MTMQAPKLDSKAFWQYSVSRYTTQDIAPLALLLQDNHGMNVNVLLLVCWCLENNAIINLAQLRAVIASTSPSETELVAHRAIRKAAYPYNGDGYNEEESEENGEQSGKDIERYEALKAQELQLERKQQDAMIQAFNDQRVTYLPALPSAKTSNVFNASIAALINAYSLKENNEARRLLSLVVNQLP